MRKTLEEMIKDLEDFQRTMEKHQNQVSEQIIKTTQGQVAVVRSYMQRLLENEKGGEAILKRSIPNLRKNVSLFSDKAVTAEEKEIVHRLEVDLQEFSADLAANRPTGKPV